MMRPFLFPLAQSTGVDLILGCNGLLWVQPHIEEPTQAPVPPEGHAAGSNGSAEEQAQGSRQGSLVFSRHQLEVVARIGNSIRALASAYLAIYPTTIMDTYQVDDSLLHLCWAAHYIGCSNTFAV